MGAPSLVALFGIVDQYHQNSFSGTSGADVASLTSPTYSAAGSDTSYGSDFNDITTGSDCTFGSTAAVSPAPPGNGKGAHQVAAVVKEGQPVSAMPASATTS